MKDRTIFNGESEESVNDREGVMKTGILSFI
jgi:hypothetical protein